MKLDPLTFAELRQVDVERCDTAFGPGNKLVDWSPTDWACALAGEVGEACNIIKKMRRGDEVSMTDLAKELADVSIYLDLLAARLKIDLGAAVRAKFNEVSERKKSPIRLAALLTLRQKLDMDVNELKLSVRAAGCLERGNIRHVGQLVNMSQARLMGIKNFGKFTLREIRKLLAEMGLELGMDTEGWAAK